MKSHTSTTINITKQLRTQLDKLGDIHSETYNTIIQRLIQENKGRNKK